ncbi:hypothetical protein V2I52_15140 [Brenneria sp. g21c3]|uniref:hypothetical protein n=1 Tax=Brenneria sp. g21c3 TaxID=3093893 RepID=UPI002EBE57AB|nr:hypothetical protein [Brenneria sp. g21c3]
MNNFIGRWALFSLLFLFSFCSQAGDIWHHKNVQMQCNNALLSISADCMADPEDHAANICKGINLKITLNSDSKEFKLPYMSKKQKIILEKQGDAFNDVVDETNWVPQKIYCIDDEYILIGYWNGMNNAENILGSLSLPSESPIFDFNGDFVIGDKASFLRGKAIREEAPFVYIDFVNHKD